MRQRHLYHLFKSFIRDTLEMFESNKLDLVTILLMLIIVSYFNYKLWQVPDDIVEQAAMLIAVLIIIIFIVVYFIFAICKFVFCSFF
jgi:hypothetical protein